MYTLKVKTHRQIWRWGLRNYETLEDAKQRVQVLADVGITAKIFPVAGNEEFTIESRLLIPAGEGSTDGVADIGHR